MYSHCFNGMNTSVLSEICQDKRFQKLADTAIINVGITTGYNKYFSVNQKTVDEYELQGVVRPLSGRSAHVHSVYFQKRAWKEKFFLRRNNLYPKFVLNCCNAVSTDTMHRIKFHDGIEPERILLSYYNSISFAFTELCGRSYGGGVLEILPGEVGNILVPKLDDVPMDKVKAILKIVDRIVRDNDSIEEALDIVDEEILVRELDIQKRFVPQCKKYLEEAAKQKAEERIKERKAIFAERISMFDIISDSFLCR